MSASVQSRQIGARLEVWIGTWKITTTRRGAVVAIDTTSGGVTVGLSDDGSGLLVRDGKTFYPAGLYNIPWVVIDELRRRAGERACEPIVHIDKHGMRITREVGGGWWYFSRERPEGHHCATCDNKGSVVVGQNAIATCPDCAESTSSGCG